MLQLYLLYLLGDSRCGINLAHPYCSIGAKARSEMHSITCPSRNQPFRVRNGRLGILDNITLNISPFAVTEAHITLRTYIFGRDGIFSINLGAKGDVGFGDGEWRNIECNIIQNAEPTVADPEGLIPGYTKSVQAISGKSMAAVAGR